MNEKQLDRLGWWLFWGVILGIVADAALNYIGSYGHIYVEGIHHGEYGVDARTLPIAIDLILSVLAGATVIASRLERSTWLLRLVLAFAVGTTIAANGAYGAAWGRTGALLAVWSPVGLLIVIETGLYLFRIVADAKAKAETRTTRRETMDEMRAELVKLRAERIETEVANRRAASEAPPAAELLGFPPAPVQPNAEAWQGLSGIGLTNAGQR